MKIMFQIIPNVFMKLHTIKFTHIIINIAHPIIIKIIRHAYTTSYSMYLPVTLRTMYLCRVVDPAKLQR